MKFKLGDVVKHKDLGSRYIITKIGDNFYKAKSIAHGGEGTALVKEAENYYEIDYIYMKQKIFKEELNRLLNESEKTNE